MKGRRAGMPGLAALVAVLTTTLSFPGCGGDPLARSRDRALGYFSAHVSRADPTWANLLGYVHRRFGTEVESAGGEPLHLVPDDPTRPELAALYRRLVDPRARVAKVAIAGLPTPIDRITASALHCDRIALPPDWVEILRRASDLGGYALTHATLAGEWTLENDCLPWHALGSLQADQVDALVTMIERPDSLAREFRTSTDLWIEAIVMLYYLRAETRVEPAWIERLLALQRPDGGWSSSPDAPVSDPHATALALWVLLENLQPDAPSITWIPRP